MKPRFRPFGNLYHQFISGSELDGILQWYDVAEAFRERGLIRFIPDKHGTDTFQGYIETEVMRSIDSEKFEQTIEAILREVARASKCAKRKE